MAPPSYESGFDSMSRTGLQKLGMDPGFIADFENYEKLRETFDFTKVDTTFRKNLVDTAGKISSKRAFEEAGKVVDRGLEVMAGVLGATGQWYGTAAALLSEEAMDWAEKKFESYMGWNEEDAPVKGHWVLIDEGTNRRRRLPGGLMDEFDDETSAKNPLIRSLVAAYADENPHNGYVHLVDQNMRERNEPVEKLRRVTDKIEAELEASAAGIRMKDLIVHHHHGLRRPVVDMVKGRVGQNVSIQGETFVITPGTTVSRVEAERNGKHVSLPWDDDSVQTAWNANNGASTFRSGPGDWEQDDFIQTAGFHRGELVFRGEELFVIVAVKGDLVTMWSAWDCRSEDTSVDELTHFDDSQSIPKIMKSFRAAALNGDETGARASLPSKSYGHLTSGLGAKPDSKFVPYQTRGRPATAPQKYAGTTNFYDTPARAKGYDADRERYDKLASSWPDQAPPHKATPNPDSWETMSDDSWGAAQWDRPNPPESSGVTFLPIALLGLGAAFALTR